jgi:hypothetical protein
MVRVVTLNEITVGLEKFDRKTGKQPNGPRKIARLATKEEFERAKDQAMSLSFDLNNPTHLEVLMSYGTLNGNPASNEKTPEEKQKRNRVIKIAVSIFALFAVLDLINLFVVSSFQRKVATEKTVQYTTYTNHHGAYSVCFDPAVFSRKTAPASSNSQTFVSKDGLASFTIYTSKLGNWTLAQLMDQDAEAYTQAEDDTVISGKGLGSYTYNIEAKRVGEHFVELALMDNQTTVNRLKAQFDTKTPNNYAAQLHRIVRCFESTRESNIAAR